MTFRKDKLHLFNIIIIILPLLSFVKSWTPVSSATSLSFRLKLRFYHRETIGQIQTRSRYRLFNPYKKPFQNMSSLSSSKKSMPENCSDGSFRSDDKINNNVSTSQILWDFATHTHESYHYFDPNEAKEIRSSLLNWYRLNRRKLPWRGDAGPFDGSTAGINSSSLSSSSKSKKRKMNSNSSSNDSAQKSIKSFFNSTSARRSNKKEDSEKDNGSDLVVQSDAEKKIIPVTGYSVWVSEIMLQQTRVEAVIPYYLKWMDRFPTVHDLAKATDDEVNSYWAGLGFYRRARMLHKGAKYVSQDLDGTMPQTVDELMKIDGIGRYTASAIASIAFNTCVPVVDGNVCRVLARLKGIANNIKAPVFKDGIGWKLAEQIVKAGDGLHAGEVNQAMMELGATYCAPSGTGIDHNDPLKQFYLSTTIGMEVQQLIYPPDACNNGINQSALIHEFISNATSVRGYDSHVCSICDIDAISTVLHQIADDLNDDVKENAATIGHANFPIAPPKKAKREEILVIAALSLDCGKKRGGEHWLMVKRPNGGLLAGQWEFPSQCIWSSSLKGDNKSEKTKAIEIPTFPPDSRRKGIIDLLQQYDFSNEKGESIHTASELLLKEGQKITVANDDSPVEHIFSHVRHTMWIEHGEIVSFDPSITKQSYFLQDGREYKWMNADGMKKVGMTSAINKILSVIYKGRDKNTSSNTKKDNKRKKT